MTARTSLARSVLALLAVVAAPALATDYASVQPGNWNDPATWSPSGVPVKGDNVSIEHRVVVDANDSITNLTIATTGRLVMSAAYNLFVYGNWTNNGNDSLRNGYVYLRGAGNVRIGGSTPTMFYRLYINKGSTSDTVYLNQNIKIAYPGSSAMMVNTGNFVTNGYNLDADTTNCRVDGATTGRFWVTGSSQVDIYYLYQWGLGYFYMTSPTATLNIYRQDIANSGHRTDIYAGTVNYLATGSTNNLQLYTNSAGWGWFARGGTITFHGSLSVGNYLTIFRASDSAVVKFAGSANSTVNLHSWATSPARVGWHFNDLRIEKTGGATVTFSHSGAALIDTSVTAHAGVTVNSGAGLVLSGSFYPDRSFDFHNVTNNGTITHTSAPIHVGGSWTGSGTLVPNTNTVTFDSSTAASLAGGPFYRVSVNKPGGSLSMTGNVTVADSLTIAAGTFSVGERTLTLGAASAPGNVAVNGGTFSAVGTGFAGGVVAAASQSHPYSFTVGASASLAARYATFRYMNNLGIAVAGTLNVANNLSDCTFEHGASSGPMLAIASTQTVDDMYNVSFHGTAGYNIEKLNSSGHLTIIGGSGNRWGAAHENDPNGRVDWITPDVGVAAVLSPRETLPINQEVFPYVKLKNYGSASSTFDVVTRIMLGANWVYHDTIRNVNLAPGDSFNRYHPRSWTPNAENGYTVQSYTVLRGDVNHANDTAYSVGTVVSYDVGVTAINRPTGSIGEGNVIVPEVIVTNFGPIPATTSVRLIIDNGSDAPVYDTTETGISVPIGSAVKRAFAKTWTATPQQQFTVTSFTTLPDVNRHNDTTSGTFSVVPPWPYGWSEVEPLPVGAKPVKDGGWLAAVDDRGTIFAAKGNKTGEFYSFDVRGDSNGVWNTLTPMPNGTEGKPPYKGAVGVVAGSNVYATKGNNKPGFWRYNSDSLTWTQLSDVPLGSSGKNPKGGTDMVYVVEADTGWVYLLKGQKTDFFRFNTVSGVWDTSLPPAPTGANAKWDKGSWMVYDGVRGTIYAHKAKYHELWAFDVATHTWASSALPGMPLAGMMGKSKKSKDGGSAAWAGDAIYALKGGNTQEFWKFMPGTLTWTELDTIPAMGSTGKKKRIKAGADIACWDYAGVLFALKGNKTLEMWRYVTPAIHSTSVGRDGVMFDPARVMGHGFTLTPNPTRRGLTTLRYSLPNSGVGTMRVFDASGRSVRTYGITAANTVVDIDLRGLAAGVYLVRLEARGYRAVSKLVVE